jgi:hypothetical protein
MGVANSDPALGGEGGGSALSCKTMFHLINLGSLKPLLMSEGFVCFCFLTALGGLLLARQMLWR